MSYRDHEEDATAGLYDDPSYGPDLPPSSTNPIESHSIEHVPPSPGQTPRYSRLNYSATEDGLSGPPLASTPSPQAYNPESAHQSPTKHTTYTAPSRFAPPVSYRDKYEMRFRIRLTDLVNQPRDAPYETAPQKDPNEWEWCLRIYYHGYTVIDSDYMAVYVKGVYTGALPTPHSDPSHFFSFGFNLVSSGVSRGPIIADVKEFSTKPNDWGVQRYIKRSELNECLAVTSDPDALEFAVFVKPQWPNTPQTSKLRTGMVGILNQGATCYLNSLLQTLFCTRKLRRGLYQVDTSQDQAGEGVVLELQRLFHSLQTADEAQSTLDLTKAFGWTSYQAFTQQDVQELLRNLLDKVEERLKGTDQANLIKNLFSGTTLSFVRCINVDYASERAEEFFDLQLQIKGVASVMEAFKRYTETERLDGDNQYESVGFGKQDADKGVRFLSFPPVLHLHLKRFEYDWNLDRSIKINDQFKFDKTLVLDEFLHTSAAPLDEPYEYSLHSVLVHEGDVAHGHYYVFIRQDGPTSERWLKFNDDLVTEVEERVAIEENFGSEYRPYSSTASFDEKRAVHAHSTSNAYMLVYCRTSAWADVMEGDELAPQQLIARFQQDIEDKQAEHDRAERLKHTLTVNLVRLHDIADFSALGARPARRYDGDVCDWYEFEHLELGDARDTTLAEAEALIRSQQHLEPDVVLWTSTTLSRSRRVDKPFCVLPPNTLAKRAFNLMSCADSVFVLIDDVTSPPPAPDQYYFLVRELVNKDLQGARMVCVDVPSPSARVALLADAIRAAFGLSDVLRMGVLVSIREKAVLLCEDKTFGDYSQDLRQSTSIVLFQRMSGEQPRHSIAEYCETLADGLVVEFRGFSPSCECIELITKVSTKWSSCASRLARRLFKDEYQNVHFRFTLPDPLEPLKPRILPLTAEAHSQSISETLRSTHQALPRPPVMGQHGANGRVVCFYERIPVAVTKVDLEGVVWLDTAVFYAGPMVSQGDVEANKRHTLKGRWDVFDLVHVDVEETHILDDVLDVLTAEVEAYPEWRASHLYTVRDGQIDKLFRPETKLDQVMRASHHGCAIYCNPPAAPLVLTRGLVCQVDDDRWHDDTLRLQVVCCHARFDGSVDGFGVPALVKVAQPQEETLASLWAKAMKRLGNPSKEVQATLRPGFRPNGYAKIEWLDHKKGRGSPEPGGGQEGFKRGGARLPMDEYDSVLMHEVVGKGFGRVSAAEVEALEDDNDHHHNNNSNDDDDDDDDDAWSIDAQFLVVFPGNLVEKTKAQAQNGLTIRSS